MIIFNFVGDFSHWATKLFPRSHNENDWLIYAFSSCSLITSWWGGPESDIGRKCSYFLEPRSVRAGAARHCEVIVSILLTPVLLQFSVYFSRKSSLTSYNRIGTLLHTLITPHRYHNSSQIIISVMNSSMSISLSRQ